MFTYKPVCPLVSAGFIRSKATVTDPVQQLFLDKIREYRSKMQPGVVFVEPSPAIVKEYEKEIGKLEKTYGGGKGIDMTQFPEIKFQEPKLDSIDEELPKNADKSTKGVDKKKK